jgi:hypothetical protein
MPLAGFEIYTVNIATEQGQMITLALRLRWMVVENGGNLQVIWTAEVVCGVGGGKNFFQFSFLFSEKNFWCSFF